MRESEVENLLDAREAHMKIAFSLAWGVCSAEIGDLAGNALCDRGGQTRRDYGGCRDAYMAAGNLPVALKARMSEESMDMDATRTNLLLSAMAFGAGVADASARLFLAVALGVLGLALHVVGGGGR